MKRTLSRISGFATGWLLLGGLILLLPFAAPPLAWSEAAAPKEKPKKTQAAPPKTAPAQAAPAKRAEAPRGVVSRRDPFRSLVVRPEDIGGGKPLPPGKRGLVIAQLTLNGIVASGSGNIAVVTMLGRNRAYFLRARDELFDGYVSQIGRASCRERV